MEQPLPEIAVILESVLRRGRQYGLRAVCFASGPDGQHAVRAYVDSLIEAGLVTAGEEAASIMHVLTDNLVDIRGLEPHDALITIGGSPGGLRE